MFEIVEDQEEILRSCSDPYKLVVVEESPQYANCLLFQTLDPQKFYDEYHEFISRYCILSELFTLDFFVARLREDGFSVFFLPSCQSILSDYSQWHDPLRIDSLRVPGGGDLYPYQSFSLRRALERSTARSPEDRLFFFMLS